MASKYVSIVAAILFACAVAQGQSDKPTKPSSSKVWIAQTVTGGITGGSRRIVVHSNGEVLELQMSPGREKSNPLGKLDDASQKALTEMIADMPQFIAPEKDKGKVVDGQMFEIRVRDEQKALWYTATADTPERVKKLSNWLAELPDQLKKAK